MKTITSVAIAAVLAVGLAGSLSSSAFARKCVTAGGQGTGITNEVATFMAKAALGNSIKKMGAKARGKVRVSCKTDLLLISTCTARQRACK